MKSVKKRFNKKQFTKKQKKPMTKNVKKKFSKYAKKKFSKKHNRRKTVYLKKRIGGVPASSSRLGRSFQRVRVNPLPLSEKFSVVEKKWREASLNAEKAGEVRKGEERRKAALASGVRTDNQSKMLGYMYDSILPSYNAATRKRVLPEFKILDDESKKKIRTSYYNKFSMRDRQQLSPVKIVDGVFSHTYYPTTPEDIRFLKDMYDAIWSTIYNLSDHEQDVAFRSQRDRFDILQHLIITHRPSGDDPAFYLPYPMHSPDMEDYDERW